MRLIQRCALLFVYFTSAVLSAQIPLRPASSSEPASGSRIRTFRSKDHDHSIRLIEQDDSICDARVKQWTGWLDIGTKHLFFWFFESRNSPEDDPLLLWLNGGPGDSSMIGLFQETGPCSINEHGNGSTHNPFGWNAHANLLYVDQPVTVGYSYVDHEYEDIPSNSVDAAVDMHVFLQIFTSGVFPALKNRELHMAGRHYAAHYLPALGTRIKSENERRPKDTQINSKSLIVGNGIFDYAYMVFGQWETACTTNPGIAKTVLSKTLCDHMAAGYVTCIDAIASCRADDSDMDDCRRAFDKCHDYLDPIQRWWAFDDGNPNDISKPCGSEFWQRCDPVGNLAHQYLDSDKVREILEIPEQDIFRSPSPDVEMGFMDTKEEILDVSPAVIELLDKGIDVLLYQGNFDLVAPTAGNYKWARDLLWQGQPEFNAKPKNMWQLRNGSEAGWFKEVFVRRGGARDRTRFSFVTINGAGHFAPHDKPEVTLDMLTRWMYGREFS